MPTNLLIEVTLDDVTALGDADARSLIARLCEAEIHARGRSAVGLIAGGDQNAGDGGSDVRVTGLGAGGTPGFIPRPETVFQVKAEAMPPSKITPEMRPGGVLRPIIVDLAAKGGAYVIASTRDNPSDLRLAQRTKPMADALDPGVVLHLDFYGADRIATWANRYPGVVLWMRAAAGRPLVGWRGWGSWSASDQPADSPYLTDEATRVRGPDGDPVTTLVGLAELRDRLRQPASSVRLVGLSGHGKTRFAQALFDPGVESDALGQELAVYGDVGRGVEPSPLAMAEQLVGLGRRAILVVDNCPPDTHRSLVEVVHRAGSTVGLLTVEYDVGEDDVEGSVEYRIGPSDDDMVERLLKARGFDLSDPDRRRVAEFSGGNARIALALARAAAGKGSLASLKDAELLQRLFGRAPNPRLAATADVASLVVSFDIAQRDGPDAEAPVLADLAGVSFDDFYADVSALLGRELVQQRRDWRAVLPQALAAKFARNALSRLHPERIWKALIEDAPPRLRSSFLHRLGLLHEVPEAEALARRLLASDGSYGSPHLLDETGLRGFQQLAPAAPEAALAALERGGAAGLEAMTDGDRERLIGLIGHLAYEPALFDRAVTVLAGQELQAGDRRTSSGELVAGLFHLYLSGTAAPAAQRFAVIGSWIGQGELARSEFALAAALKASHFTSIRTPEFGARRRDHGWRPATEDELRAWFEEALRLTRRLGEANRAAALELLSDSFRSLWAYAPIRTRLLADAEALWGGQHDDGLWFAVTATLSYDKLPDDHPDQIALRAFEAKIRPANLDEQIATYVFNPPFKFFDTADGDRMAAMERAAETARSLGRSVADDLGRIADIAERSYGVQFSQALAFGEGVAQAAADLEARWSLICSRLPGSNTRSHPGLLQGFLRGARDRDPGRVEVWLVAASTDRTLGPHMLALEAALGIDKPAVDRLIRALETGVAPLETFFGLGNGGASNEVGPDDFRRLIQALGASERAQDIAVDALSMRLMHERELGAIGDGWVRLAGDVLRAFTFRGKVHTMLDHHLGELAKVALPAPEGDNLARQLAAGLKSAVLAHRGGEGYSSLAQALFRHQPMAALDELLETGSAWHRLASTVSGYEIDPEDTPGANERRPIDSLDPHVATAWMSEDPVDRGRRLAQAVVYVQPGATGGLAWTPMARRLLDDPVGHKLLATFFERFMLGSGWGTLQDRLLRRRPLLRELFDHPNLKLAQEARRLDAELDRQIEWAASLDRSEGDQTFE